MKNKENPDKWFKKGQTACKGEKCKPKPQQYRNKAEKGTGLCPNCYEYELLQEVGIIKRDLRDTRIFEPRPIQIG